MHNSLHNQLVSYHRNVRNIFVYLLFRPVSGPASTVEEHWLWKIFVHKGPWFDTRRRISLFRRYLVSQKGLTEISNKNGRDTLTQPTELETAVATRILLYEGECSPENWSFDVILVCGKTSY